MHTTKLNGSCLASLRFFWQLQASLERRDLVTGWVQLAHLSEPSPIFLQCFDLWLVRTRIGRFHCLLFSRFQSKCRKDPRKLSGEYLAGQLTLILFGDSTSHWGNIFLLTTLCLIGALQITFGRCSLSIKAVLRKKKKRRIWIHNVHITNRYTANKVDLGFTPSWYWGACTQNYASAVRRSLSQLSQPRALRKPLH